MNETLRQAIAEAKEQQPVTVELNWYQGAVQLDDIKQYIRANINSASRSFVAIGYYLKYIRDRELFSEDGYNTIWEFAQAEFGISKSSASRFMAINDRFSKDGNSPILLDRYKDFSSSKLSEMLTMTDEQLEQVTITTTRAEIRELKQSAKEVVAPAQQKTDPSIEYPELKYFNVTNKCIHQPEYLCILSDAQKVVQGDGVDCNTKCCWNCQNHSECGYECNSSAHRQDVIKTPDYVTKEANFVTKTPENDTFEPENVTETVEADIIQNIPEEQPDLPLLKNNDKRKEFINAYQTWPIWIDLKETGERYYRYDITDNVAIVVKVSLKHAWEGYRESDKINYGAEQYYLLGIKINYSTKTVFTEDDTRTFYECATNKTALVEYLKNIQKK